jgi:hypothetical protein
MSAVLLRRTRPALRLLAAALVLAACDSSSTGPEPVDFTFESHQTDFSDGPDQVEIAGEAGAVRIEGLTTWSCGTLVQRARRRGSTLTFHLSARLPSQGACPPVIFGLEYEARLRGLEPGTYRLRVLHYATEVFEQEVTVQ